MDSVAIAGVGLIGGSFGLALRRAGFSGSIAGISSAVTIERAVEVGAIDRGISLKEAAQADLVFLAQPVRAIIQTLGKLSELVSPTTIVTDAGSTKRAIVGAAAGIRGFVGGHPMAGKEISGIRAADPQLFEGRLWIFTSPPPPVLREWVERIGAHIEILSPADHDRIVALVSHAPQLLSNALFRATEAHARFGGPGLESMTRLAASPYELWRDILATNRDAVVRALDETLAAAGYLRDALAANDEEAVAAYFGNSRRR